jgi:hypothetical protein
MNRKEKRKLKKEKDSRFKRIRKIEQEELKRTIPDTLYDRILYWGLCIVIAIAPFFITFSNSNYQAIKCERIKVELYDTPQIEEYRSGRHNHFKRIVFFTKKYEKVFQMDGLNMDKYIPINQINKLLGGLEIEIEVSENSLDKLGDETIFNNYNEVYGIYFQNEPVIKNHYWTSGKEGEESKYKWLFFSLLGLLFIPYHYIKSPKIKPKLGFGIVSILCLTVLLLF